MPTHLARGPQLWCYCFSRLCELPPWPIIHEVSKDSPPRCTSRGREELLCTTENVILASGTPSLCVGQILRSQMKPDWPSATVCKQGDGEQHTHTHTQTHSTRSSICPDTSHPSRSVNEHHVVIYRRPCCRIWYISHRGEQAQTHRNCAHIHTHTHIH